MPLRQSKTKQIEDTIMRGVIEVGAFQHMECVGKDPIDDCNGCSEPVFVIVVTVAGRDSLVCGGYCLNHLFMLEPYVVLSKNKIGVDLEK